MSSTEIENARESSTEIKARSYHLDIFQHVNNARYLEFLEAARWEHFGVNNTFEKIISKNLSLAVVNINIDFISPAFVNDILLIKTKVISIGNSSVKVQQIISNKQSDKLIAKAMVTFVAFDPVKMQAHKISKELKEDIVK